MGWHCGAALIRRLTLLEQVKRSDADLTLQLAGWWWQFRVLGNQNQLDFPKFGISYTSGIPTLGMMMATVCWESVLNALKSGSHPILWGHIPLAATCPLQVEQCVGYGLSLNRASKSLWQKNTLHLQVKTNGLAFYSFKNIYNSTATSVHLCCRQSHLVLAFTFNRDHLLPEEGPRGSNFILSS